MPSRGRKPRPKQLHELQGTDRADRHSGSEPIPQGDLPEPPGHLGELARAYWLKVADELQGMGLGTSADAGMLEHMAVLYERARVAEDRMPEGGFYVCERTGNPKRHPAATEALQCRKELRICEEAMGLSQPGRARIKLPDRPKGNAFLQMVK